MSLSMSFRPLLKGLPELVKCFLVQYGKDDTIERVFETGSINAQQVCPYRCHKVNFVSKDTCPKASQDEVLHTLPFEQKYPKIGLRVTALNAYEIQQGLENFSLDVAVTYLDDKLRGLARTKIFYRQEYDLLIRRGACKLSGRESVAWEEIKPLPLCLLTEEIETVGSEVGQILVDNHRGVPHIDTTSMYILMDHVRTGKWASVLPHTVQILIAGNSELEAIPLRRVDNTTTEVGIAIPHREPACHLAEAFFEVATSPEVTKRLHHSMHPAHAAA